MGQVAKQLLQRGNVVIVTGRDQERLRAVRQQLPALHTFQSDVSDPDAIAKLSSEVLTQFPALDTLINNAGVMRNLDLNRDRDLRDVTREIEINLSGPVRMVQQFLPHLKKRKAALIVNVSSGLAFVPFPESRTSLIHSIVADPARQDGRYRSRGCAASRRDPAVSRRVRRRDEAREGNGSSRIGKTSDGRN